MAFISLACGGGDLRLETRTTHGRRDGRKDCGVRLRAARTSRGGRATGVNTASGANPSGGLLGGSTSFLHPHHPTPTFAHVRTTQARTHTYARNVRPRAHAVALAEPRFHASPRPRPDPDAISHES